MTIVPGTIRRAAIGLAATAACLGVGVGATAARALPPAPRRTGVVAFDLWVDTAATPVGVPGGTVVVTISWGNHGPGTSALAVLRLVPPAGTQLVPPTRVSGWRLDAGTAYRPVPTLSSGARHSASVRLRIDPGVDPGVLLVGGIAAITPLWAMPPDRAPDNDSAFCDVLVTRPATASLSGPTTTVGGGTRSIGPAANLGAAATGAATLSRTDGSALPWPGRTPTVISADATSAPAPAAGGSQQAAGAHRATAAPAAPTGLVAAAALAVLAAATGAWSWRRRGRPSGPTRPALPGGTP